MEGERRTLPTQDKPPTPQAKIFSSTHITHFYRNTIFGKLSDNCPQFGTNILSTGILKGSIPFEDSNYI